LGFKTIRVNSNGKRLADRELADRLVDAGVTEWCISLHSADAAQSDRITARPGFEKRIAGIRNVCRRVPVMLNFVVHDVNFRGIPEFVDFVHATFGRIRRPRRLVRSLPRLARLPGLSRRGAPHICISFVELLPGFPMDTALLPRYSDAVPYLERALAANRRISVHQMHTLPPCVVSARFRKHVLAPANRNREGRIYLDRCGDCRLKTRCHGISQAYLDRYGDLEFQ